MRKKVSFEADRKPCASVLYNPFETSIAKQGLSRPPKRGGILNEPLHNVFFILFFQE